MKRVFDFINRYWVPLTPDIKPQIIIPDVFEMLANNFRIIESQPLDYPEGSDVDEFVLQFDTYNLFAKYEFSDRGDNKKQQSMLKFSGVQRFVQSGSMVGPVIRGGIGKLSLVDPGDEFIDLFLGSHERKQLKKIYTYYVDIEGAGVLLVCCTHKVRKCDAGMMELIQYIPDEIGQM